LRNREVREKRFFRFPLSFLRLCSTLQSSLARHAVSACPLPSYREPHYSSNSSENQSELFLSQRSNQFSLTLSNRLANSTVPYRQYPRLIPLPVLPLLPSQPQSSNPSFSLVPLQSPPELLLPLRIRPNHCSSSNLNVPERSRVLLRVRRVNKGGLESFDRRKRV